MRSQHLMAVVCMVGFGVFHAQIVHGQTVLERIPLPSLTPGGSARSPFRVNPFVNWQGDWWTPIRSDFGQPVTFFNLRTRTERQPYPYLWQTSPDGYAQFAVFANGNLGFWTGWRAQTLGTFAVVTPGFDTISSVTLTNFDPMTGTQGAITFGDGLLTLAGSAPSNCWHKLQFFRGRPDGAVTADSPFLLAPGHSTCVTFWYPYTALVPGADGFVYAAVVRDSNDHGYLDFVRLDPGTGAIRTNYPRPEIGGEIPPVYACRSGSNLVFSTTAHTPLDAPGMPFNLAKWWKLFVGPTPDALSEYVNTNVWCSVYHPPYVAAWTNGDIFQAGPVWDPSDGTDKTLLEVWRWRAGRCERFWSQKLRVIATDWSAVRGIQVVGDELWLAYRESTNQQVVTRLSLTGSAAPGISNCPPCEPVLVTNTVVVGTNFYVYVQRPCGSVCTNTTTTIKVNPKGREISRTTTFTVRVCE